MPSATVQNAGYSSGSATITTATANGFSSGQSVTVEGVLPSGYDGTHTITVLDSTQFSYTLATNPGDYASGGTATIGGIAGSTPLAFDGEYTLPTGVLYQRGTFYDPATGQYPDAATASSRKLPVNGCKGSVTDPGLNHDIPMSCYSRKWFAYNFFLGKLEGIGVKKRQAVVEASSVMGNLWEESALPATKALNPTVVESGCHQDLQEAWRNPEGCGVGIAQWTYPYARITWLRSHFAPNEKKKLEKHWSGGRAYLSYKIQYNYVWWEMNHWHKTTGYSSNVPLNDLVTRRTLFSATYHFMNDYEGPGQGHLMHRVGDAQSICTNVGHGRKHPGECAMGAIPAKAWGNY